MGTILTALATFIGTLWVARKKEPNEQITALATTVKSLYDENERLTRRVSEIEMKLGISDKKLEECYEQMRARIEEYEIKLGRLYARMEKGSGGE